MQVSTADQARSLVAAARFPPVGKRGFGSPFTQASWGLSASEYLKDANDGVLVIGQIETPEGVQNLRDILSVVGLGVPVSFNPSRDESLTERFRRSVHWSLRSFTISWTPGS